MAKTHLRWMDTGLGGIALCGTAGHDIQKTSKPKEVTCRNCVKSMKRRNREGDW